MFGMTVIKMVKQDTTEKELKTLQLHCKMKKAK